MKDRKVDVTHGHGVATSSLELVTVFLSHARSAKLSVAAAIFLGTDGKQTS
jgi:hypothetical protein